MSINKCMATGYNFEKLAKTGRLSGYDIKRNTEETRNWFRSQAQAVKSMSGPKFRANATPFQNVENLSENSIGRMYTFVYDPKWKETLPYYDTFPLIFPIDIRSDRMLGLNMHYLPPYLRARLMDSIYQTINNSKFDKTTKLQINYDILKAASQFKYFKPCLKMYLYAHVRSPYMNINPKQWDYTLMLPLARFQKKSQEFVWMDSLLKVN
jgi:hypothetical protein